ncbi:unnamed protein product [Rotaria sp. Silwood2]|nr:unnamed protein product [Rotaria sp. Silwood2]
MYPVISLYRSRQTSANDDRASECSSTASSKPPMYPLTPTSQTRHGYTSIGLKQRELRTKLHKTRYVQSLRQTNTSPTMFDSPSSRRTPTLSPHRPPIAMPMALNKTNELNNERRNIDDDDENDSLFSELRMSSIPSSNFSQNDARLPPPVPSNATNKIAESKLNATKTPTTLSIEERRVQESLDRLDQQLKDSLIMLKSKPTPILKKKNDDANLIDSDTSLDKYYQDDDLFSSSSSTTSKSSPSIEPKKMFIKRPTIKKDELKSGDEMKLASSKDNDPLKSGIKRPLNPLAKPDIHYSLVGDSLGSTMPGENRKDETPLSTIKFGSDTLDEEQEKVEFFRNFEKTNGEKKIDYGILNQQMELDLSPTRNGTVINSFDKQINQMSTPLHHQPNDNIIKESLSNELDREIEHEEQKMNATTTIKHVTIVEPPVRPSASVDDFSRTTKTVSDQLSTTSDMTRDLNMLQNAYKQNLSSASTIRTSRTNAFDPNKKIQQQKPTIVKNLSKPNTQTPIKKGSPSAVTRPKTAPTPTPKENKNNDSEIIEQLKYDKESLINQIESSKKAYDEELRRIQQEKYTLQAKIAQLTSTSSDGKKESITPKQREVNELEKLIDGYQAENEKLCKQIKQIEQQHKQIEQSMFDENEKLRQELIHTKMLLEQYQNSHMGTIKKQSSTIVLTNLVNNDNDKNNTLNENQQLKNEIIVLKNKLTTVLNKEHKSEDDDTLRSLDQRRIKDLERQVKELELINRRRQQNSTTQVGMVLNPLDDRNQLEIKLNKAEEVLRERQISEEKLVHELNVLEEKYSLMKQMLTKNNGQQTINNDQFEKQFHDVLNKNKNLTGQIHLRRENERLKNELEKLKTEQVPKPAKSLKRDLETIKLLRSDLERKNDELEKLRALYDAVTVQHKSLLAEREREKTRLAIMGNKPYQPDRFTQVLSSVDTVRAENEQLKHLVEKLEHDSQQQYTELMHLRDDRQAAIVLAIREKDEEILRLRQQHKLELQTIINEISSNTTETRISDLLRKIELQDSTIIHLKKLVENADESARELAILRVRDDELKSTIHRLEQELADARTYHTPEMKHFQELQNKINQLEQRWHNRDKITKDYTNSLIKQHDLDTNNDVNKLRAIIKQKNQEIERFHIELDSMLELLKTTVN